MTKPVAMVLSVVIVLIGCGRTSTTEIRNEVAEYEVYSALLDSLYIYARTQSDSILFPVIRESTLVAHTIAGVKGGCFPSGRLRMLDSLGQEIGIDPLIYRRDHEPSSGLDSIRLDTLVQRFNACNVVRLCLDSSLFSSSIRPIVVSPVVERRAFSGTPTQKPKGQLGLCEAWSGFYQRYPRSHGTVALSRVAFDDSLSQALVYWEYLRGPLAGAGEFVILARHPRRGWIVIFRHETWVS